MAAVSALQGPRCEGSTCVPHAAGTVCLGIARVSQFRCLFFFSLAMLCHLVSIDKPQLFRRVIEVNGLQELSVLISLAISIENDVRFFPLTSLF